MVADGMTKGAVDRAAIENCMGGKIEIKHELKRWEPLVRKTTESFYIAVPSLTDGSSDFVLLGNRGGATTTCTHSAVDHNPVRGYVGVSRSIGIPFGVPHGSRFPFGDLRRHYVPQTRQPDADYYGNYIYAGGMPPQHR